jgi:hypothetical protein
MRSFVHDQYAALNFRDTLGDGETRPPNVPSWVSDLSDARRMAAYRILAAYLDNCARYYLPETMWQRPLATSIVGPDQYGHAVAAQTAASKSPAEKFREYGDPRLLVEQAAALVLGESQEITVPDAAPLPDDAPDDEKAAQVRAAQFADWLAGWADDERLLLRLYEQEDDSVGLGDGVLVLGWDPEAGRTRLRKFDIESYFPVLTGDQDADEFPNRVHFAWVECPRDGVEILHRLTYDRRQLPDGETRTYAYADKPSRWAVYQTHATWDLRYLRQDTGVYDLARDNAAIVVRADGTPVDELDIGVDFMPIVHVPNTPGGGRHFGRSMLLAVAQLLDDIGFADSDLAASSEAVGNTPLVVTGGAGSPAGLGRGPGVEWNLPAGGDAKLLDTSGVLTGQIAYLNYLLERLSVNTRLAEALLGRVKPNEVPSGYALGLGFAPTRSLISKMRLVRAEKHPLILKMAMRFAQVAGVLPAGPTPRAQITLGPYLPEDLAAAVERVRSLLTAHAISTETGVAMLIAAGFPIEDAEEEVARIHAERFDMAEQLLAATGDVAAVRKFLGMDPQEQPPTPPAPPSPPTPTPPAQ